MKKIMIVSLTTILLAFTMLVSSINTQMITQAQIHSSSTGTIATGILGIDFVDEYNGWAVGCAGIILHTEDGGINWKVQSWTYSGDAYCILNDVDVVDLENVWICGHAKIEEVMYGIVIHSGDGGFTWEIQKTWRDDLGYYDFYAIEFLDELHGWVGGQLKTLFYTTDGAHWDKKELSQPIWDGITIFDIKFIDENNGWMSGGEGIWYTNNGGAIWNWVLLTSGTMYYGLDFVDLNNGWLISNFGPILHSENGGKSWNVQYLIGGMCPTAVDFMDSVHGWVTSTGGIFFTLDGGLTWSKDVSIDRDLRGLYVTPSGEVYAVGGSWQPAFKHMGCLLAVIEKSGSGWSVQLAPSMNFTVKKDSVDYVVEMSADSTLTEFNYNLSTNEITFNVFGPNGCFGVCNVTIPKGLPEVSLVDVFVDVYVDGEKANATVSEDALNYYVHIEYTHSRHDIAVSFSQYKMSGPYYTWDGVEYWIIAFPNRRPIRLCWVTDFSSTKPRFISLR